MAAVRGGGVRGLAVLRNDTGRCDPPPPSAWTWGLCVNECSPPPLLGLGTNRCWGGWEVPRGSGCWCLFVPSATAWKMRAARRPGRGAACGAGPQLPAAACCCLRVFAGLMELLMCRAELFRSGRRWCGPWGSDLGSTRA